MSLPVLAQGDDWIVVAKPPALLVHRTPMAARETRFALQIVRDQVGQHVYPVSRLDRPASGCLTFGLSSDAARELQQALQADTAVKEYVCHVRGHWRREGLIVSDKPMKDDNGRLKEARTDVHCLATQPEPRCSILHARPHTGRYHQVRRHVRDLGHPILLDQAHGDTKLNRWWRHDRGVSRLGLHCLRLSLELPRGESIRVECPLFEDLHRWWSALDLWSDAVAAEPALARPPLPLPEWATYDVTSP